MEQVVKALTEPRRQDFHDRSDRLVQRRQSSLLCDASWPARTDPVSFVNLPYDVFKAWVDTTVFVVAKRGEPTAWPRKQLRIR